MQIEALNSACVGKQPVLSDAVKEAASTNNDDTQTKETQSTSSSSTGYSWLDEAYQLVHGSGSGSGGLSGIDWNKWARSSSDNTSKTKLPFGTKVDFSNWKNIVLSNGTSYSDLPEDAFSGSYEDFQVAIYSIF